MAKIIVKKSELKKMIYEELLREDSINAKKRNNRNAEKFIRDGSGGFNGIRCYGIVSAENPDSTQQSAALNKKGMKTLAQEIKSAHYPFVRQKGRFGGNNEYSYFIFNIPLNVLMYYSAMFEQTSFIYGRKQDDGTVIHEYWEKQDASKPFNKETNPYIKKDEEASYIEIDANDNYSVIGRNFKYVIPFSIFESIQRGIMENCKKNNAEYSEEFCNWLTESVGRSGWMARGWAYKNLYGELL